jgi:1,2-phenylacetyl-CoA epoxidase PaaB subunit
MNTDSRKRYEYDVFTRIKRGNDLIHIGTVEAETDDLAKVYATYVYDEEDWIEMCVIRRDHIVHIRQPEGLFEKEGGSLNG